MPKSDPRLKKPTALIKEDVKVEDMETYKELFVSLLGTGFEMLTDIRQTAKVKHRIKDCMGIILFCEDDFRQLF